MMKEDWQAALDRFTHLEARLARGSDARGLAVVRVRLGETLFRLDRRPAAEKMLLDGLSGLPAGDPALKEDRALAQMALAKLHRSNGDRAKALMRFRAAEAEAPSLLLRLRAIYGMIKVLHYDSYSQAVREADRAIALAHQGAPGNATIEAEFRLAKIHPLRRLRRYKEAREEARRAFELFPDEFKDRLTFPRDSATALIGRTHYDAQALAAREEGDVRIRFDLGPDGTVSKCAVKDAGKSQRLAAVSCRFFIERSPLGAGVAAALRKAQDHEEMVLRWRLPDETVADADEPAGAVKLWVPSLLSDTDYPEQSARAGEQGSAVVRLDVRPDGTTAACTIVESSGYQRLDTRSCEVMMRSVFLPAIDAAGRQIPSTNKSRLTWRIPR